MRMMAMMKYHIGGIHRLSSANVFSSTRRTTSTTTTNVTESSSPSTAATKSE